MRARTALAFGLFLSAGQLMPVVAFAETSAAEQAAARSLFDEARRLVKAGDFARACPKFEESQRLHPGIGTLFNLANCYEKSGKVATAWTTFLKAAAEAAIANQPERESIARKRADALSATLPHIRLDVASPDEIEIFIDGIALHREAWADGVPVDPGEHIVRATAPGKNPWEQSLSTSVGAQISVRVPELVPLDQGPPAHDAAPAAPGISTLIGPRIETARTVAPRKRDVEPGMNVLRTGSFVATGVGVAALGIGTFLAFRAKDLHNDACDSNGCDQAGAALQERAVKDIKVASAIAISGALIGVAGGVGLWLTAKSSASPRVALRVSPSRTQLDFAW